MCDDLQRMNITWCKFQEDDTWKMVCGQCQGCGNYTIDCSKTLQRLAKLQKTLDEEMEKMTL